MRNLFSKKKKDNSSSRHSSVNSQTAPQTPQAATQARQVRPGEPFRSQGDELARNNDYKGALVMYDAALLSAPNDPSLLLSRSMVHSTVEPPNLDLALKDADCAIQLEPSRWQAWMQKGQILLQRDDLQSAEEALTNAAGFAQDFDRVTAQRALADVRARRAQAAERPSPRAAAIPASNQSNIPLRPAPTTSSPRSPASNAASRTTQPLSMAPPATLSSPPTTATSTTPSTIPSATTNSSSTTRQSLKPATASTPHGSSTSTRVPSTSPTSSWISSAQPPNRIPSPLLAAQNATSSSTSHPNNRNPANSTTRTTQSTLTHGLNDLLGFTDSPPSDAPPAYTPNLSDPAQLQRQLDELGAALKQKNKGGLSISPYTLPGSIDAIRLLYIGLTQSELTPREYGVPTYLHPNFSRMAVGTATFPGNTFLDMDCESSASYDGKIPGTSSISGYSEEYRSQQLLTNPLLNLQLEGGSVLPDISLGTIVDRLRLLRLRSTVEDNTSLANLLGLSQLSSLQSGFHTGGNRQKQISYMCMALTRSLYDAPTRFIDFSKARFFSTNTFGSTGIGLKNFLYQMLIGAELLIRLRKEPATTNYTGLMSDASSALIVLAALWMENVVIQGPKAGLTKDHLNAYTLYASQNQRHAEALIRFGEAMEWPYMDEAQNYIENAYQDLIAARPVPSWDIYDWLFGLVLPGKHYRHRIMACLVHSSPTIRSIASAPYWDNGLVVKDKSYWPRRTVLGRVLGGMKGAKSVCGWIGPLPAPKENISGWIRLKSRSVDIPVPAQTSLSNGSVFRSLGFEDPSGRAEEANAFLESLTNPDEWIQAPPPIGASAACATVPKLKAIHLTLLSGTGASNISGLPTEEYRASLDFEISSQTITYTLYSTPIFVAAPPCVGSHVLHQRQAKMYEENIIMAIDLKDKYPPMDNLVVIDAMHEGEEVLARAWCAERGRNAVIRKGEECCFPCAASVATGRIGLGVNVLIMC